MHVALLLRAGGWSSRDSIHSKYVARQAVGGCIRSTKTTLIMLSLDDHLDHEALDIDQIDGICAPGLRGLPGRKERTHARTACRGTVSECVAQ